MKRLLALAAFLALAARTHGADESPRDAIDAGIAILQKAAASYPEHRSCFSCHHQTLPMLAMTEARAIGIRTNAELLESQAAFTHDFYDERTEQVASGEGVGGRSMTVAYSLWALDLAGRGRDAVTDALAAYLLARQEDDGRWKLQSHRPPLEESHAMTTFLSAYYLGRFAPPASADAADDAIRKASRWLAGAATTSQEDRNARLWASVRLGESDAAETERLRAQVLARQRGDGGWAQLEEMESDAYATGQTLFVLSESGLAKEHPAVRRGVAFLLKSQLPDGSWFVRTRSKPVQKFFDNGDPHGKHQFISVSATGWAVAALCRCETRP